MAALTIHEAAQTTGWSARMLRYVEQLGLVEPTRSASGYRLYGPGELERLRSLKALLERTGLELGDIAVALRLRRDQEAREAVDTWLDHVPVAGDSAALDALRWEQERHVRLLQSPLPSRHTVKDDPSPSTQSQHQEPA